MTTKLDKLRKSLEDTVRAGEVAKASLERLDFKSIQIGDEVIIVGGKLVETEVKRDGRITAKIHIPTGDGESVISTWVYWEDIKKATQTGYVKPAAWVCLTSDGEIDALRNEFSDAKAYAAHFPNMPVVPLYFAPDANKDEALKKAYCRGVEDYKDGAWIDSIAENLLSRFIKEKPGDLRIWNEAEGEVVYQLEIKQVGTDFEGGSAANGK